MKDEKREAFLLGKTEGLAIAKIEFERYADYLSDYYVQEFYKSLDSEIAKIQLGLLANEGE